MKKIKILFQGDSITANAVDKIDSSLGNGYPKYVARLLKEKYSEVDFEFVNEGVFGNTTADLLKRVQTDVVDVNPDVVSLFIGINDALRFESDNLSLEMIKSNYERILTEIKTKTHAKILMIEPYLIPNDVYKRYEKRKYLTEIIETVRTLAYGYADEYLAVDGRFAEQFVKEDANGFTVDGLHLNEKGAKFIGGLYAEKMSKIIDGILNKID